MLTNYLLQSCDIVTVLRNRYGDKVDSGREKVACRWRWWEYIYREAHAEVAARDNRSNSDALVWFNADASVERGTILLFDNEYFEVVALVQARKLRSADVQFIKCVVKRIEITNAIS